VKQTSTPNPHSSRPARRAFLHSAVAAALILPGRPAAAQTRMRLRIGATANDSFAEAYYAQDLGYFARAGIDAEITTFANGAQVSTGVASGALDVGISSVITLANATIRGLPFVYIAGGGMYTAAAPTIELCVTKDSPLRTARELEGKTVSVSGIKDITHLAVVTYLLKNGADPQKVNIIEMPFSQVSAALKRGAIAAGIISEPSLSAASDDVRVLAKPFELIGKRLMVGGWFATSEWQKKNVATARAFATAIYETAHWANANHEKSAVILQKYAKVDDAALARMTRVVYTESLEPDMIDPTLDLASREKFTERRVHAADMIAT
jgi:NitT/TauT family transport system substrate-binding protein